MVQLKQDGAREVLLMNVNACRAFVLTLKQVPLDAVAGLSPETTLLWPGSTILSQFSMLSPFGMLWQYLSLLSSVPSAQTRQPRARFSQFQL